MQYLSRALRNPYAWHSPCRTCDLCLETRPWDAPFLKLELFGTQKLLSIPGTVKLLESPGRAGGLLIIINRVTHLLTATALNFVHNDIQESFRLFAGE